MFALRLTSFLFAVLSLSCATPPVAGVAGATTCSAAALRITDDTVVGTLLGQPVRYSELGDSIKSAERQALASYCNAIADGREAAFAAHVQKRLVSDAAKAAGLSEPQWMQKQMEAKATEPTDAELRAVYDGVASQQPPGAVPPFEMVKDQVAASVRRQQQGEVAAKVVKELTAGANFKATLPDVRPAPVTIPAGSNHYVKGKAGAKIRVTEFADFQCPYCSLAAETMAGLAAKFGDRVEFGYRHYPLRGMHPEAQKAGEVAQCAGAQGKFWAVHDALYANQEALDEAGLKAATQKAGVDEAQLTACLASGKGKAEVDADYELGNEVGVQGTPAFFVNGRLVGDPSPEGMTAAIEAALRDGA
jgi:protein-disulfide isomerase